MDRRPDARIRRSRERSVGKFWWRKPIGYIETVATIYPLERWISEIHLVEEGQQGMSFSCQIYSVCWQ